MLIASDLPMQGPSSVVTEQMVAAIRQMLDNYEWKAGDYNVAYQACDDSTAQAANYDTGKCSQNGNAYAVNDRSSLFSARTTRRARRSSSRS